MGRFLVVLGLVLLAGGSFLFLKFNIESFERTGIEGIGSGFDGVLAIPPDEVNAAVDSSNLIANNAIAAAIRMERFAGLLLFAVFAIGALISMCAGIQKIRQRDAPVQHTLTVAVGLLGAASAISASGAKYLDGLAKDRYACVKTLDEEIAATIEDVRLARSELRARQALSEMKRVATRCEI